MATSENPSSTHRRKIALIIGNEKYKRTENKLNHPVKNAQDMSDLLHSIDFNVENTHLNVKRDEEMNVILREFADKIDDGDLVLFYFCGHAYYAQNKTYLIPTDDRFITTDHDVPDFSVDAQHALDVLAEKNKSFVSIFIVDCSVPYSLQSQSTFEASVTGTSAGASIQVICTANRTSDTAPAQHSTNLFTKVLLDNIAAENVTITSVFRRLRDLVDRESRQTKRVMIMNQLQQHQEVCLNEVIVFRPDIPADAKWKSKARTVVGGHGPGDTLDTIRCPQGLHITQKRTIFVADSANHRIIEYKSNGETSRKITGKNINDDGLNRLDRPSDILYDAKSRTLIIGDHGHFRVMRRNLKNNTYAKVIGEGVACFGLAIDEEGALYVSDTEKHEVRRYPPGSQHGTVVAGGHGQGRRLHQLNRPTYISIGTDQSVYVSDSLNDRVMKWKKDAEKGIVVAGGCGKGKDLTQLYCPAGLVVDRSGTMYVADHWNDRVMRWRQGAARGEVIAGDKYLAGCSAHELNGPEGIAFDRDGNLYVADSYNHRIQCFSIQKD